MMLNSVCRPQDGWLTHENSTSIPSHLANPLRSSLLGHVLVTSNASVDTKMGLDEALENMDILLDTINST